MKLSGDVAIITGGAGYIGQAIATTLAQHGASVVVADIHGDGAEKVARDLQDQGYSALGVQVDLTDRMSIKDMTEKVMAQFGTITVLVNNAGGSARLVGGGYCSFHEADASVIDKMIDINLKAPLFCTHAVLQHMVPQGNGRIVNIGSITGVQGSTRVADYSSAKGGVIAFTKALAKEVGPLGIRVNCISPGLVPRTEQDLARALRSNFLNNTAPTGEDIAKLALFLASDDSRVILGQNYIIDGGRSLALYGD